MSLYKAIRDVQYFGAISVGQYFEYTAVQKFGISNILICFKRSFLCSSRLFLFDKKYRIVYFVKILLQFKITVFYLTIL